MSNPITPRLASLATAVPENFILQDDVIEITDGIFSAHFENYAKLRSVFTNAGIYKRHIAMPVEWYLEPRNWPDRTDVFLDHATTLFVEASKQALEKAELSCKDIDAVVTITSTGIATPSLEARAAQTLGLRQNVIRVPVFGTGCFGGIAGLTLAERLARSSSNYNVLLVVVELCTMSFRLDKITNANVVATALFGDGAAAAVISTQAGKTGLQLGTGHQHMWPDTLNIMGWNVDPNGFEVVFDRAIPPFARRHVRPAVDSFLDEMSLPISELSRLTFHPGGTRVLEALEAAFELQAGTLDHERDVLRDYGNMSSPTVLFVLKNAMEAGLQGQSLLSALGPGFTAASIPVKVLS